MRFQMSFEIPGTTGQVLEGSSNLYDTSGVFCLMVTNVYCWGGGGIGLMLPQILIIPSAPTENHTFCPNTYIANTPKKKKTTTTHSYPSKKSYSHKDTELH